MTLSGHSDRLPEGVQDGILTAKEISTLDLRETDIVVLSACETAQGVITGEGVFGLQRAFKMAGAKTIMMTLWQVNDRATNLFMTSFFRHYSQGMSKRQAFRLAQQEVRNYTGEGSSDDSKALMSGKERMQSKSNLTSHQPSEVSGQKAELPSLEINFCDMVCENPFFLASSAVCTNYDMVARAFEAGWAGVFYKTITKADIREVSPRFDAVRKEGTPFVGFRNMEQLSENPYTMDFDILRRLKQNYPSKRVIASIMGQTEEEWIELAKMAEEAGCDAVELNFSCPQMRLTGLGSDIGQNSELILFYTSYVRDAVSIPVIPKMTPNIMSMTSPALACFYAGASGISAINTIKSITMSHEAEVSEKKTVSGYSGKAVKPIALRMIYEMTGNPILHKAGIEKHMDISGIGGIETWRDALEFIQLGCRNVQVCTAVMQYGYRIIDDLILGLQHYMASRGITELKKLVGE